MDRARRPRDGTPFLPPLAVSTMSPAVLNSRGVNGRALGAKGSNGGPSVTLMMSYGSSMERIASITKTRGSAGYTWEVPGQRMQSLTKSDRSMTTPRGSSPVFGSPGSFASSGQGSPYASRFARRSLETGLREGRLTGGVTFNEYVEDLENPGRSHKSVTSTQQLIHDISSGGRKTSRDGRRSGGIEPLPENHDMLFTLPDSCPVPRLSSRREQEAWQQQQQHEGGRGPSSPQWAARTSGGYSSSPYSSGAQVRPTPLPLVSFEAGAACR